MHFPLKLYEIVQAGPHDVVAWSDSGKSFLVVNTDTFCNTVLPRHFRHNKLTSFQRQLNLYGFQRVLKGAEAGRYRHPRFERGRPDLVASIKRESRTGDEAAPLAKAVGKGSDDGRRGGGPASGRGSEEEEEEEPEPMDLARAFARGGQRSGTRSGSGKLCGAAAGGRQTNRPGPRNLHRRRAAGSRGASAPEEDPAPDGGAQLEVCAAPEDRTAALAMLNISRSLRACGGGLLDPPPLDRGLSFSSVGSCVSSVSQDSDEHRSGGSSIDEEDHRGPVERNQPYVPFRQAGHGGVPRALGGPPLWRGMRGGDESLLGPSSRSSSVSSEENLLEPGVSGVSNPSAGGYSGQSALLAEKLRASLDRQAMLEEEVGRLRAQLRGMKTTIDSLSMGHGTRAANPLACPAPSLGVGPLGSSEGPGEKRRSPSPPAVWGSSDGSSAPWEGPDAKPLAMAAPSESLEGAAPLTKRVKSEGLLLDSASPATTVEAASSAASSPVGSPQSGKISGEASEEEEPLVAGPAPCVGAAQ